MYVEIIKCEETPEMVVYSFGPSQDRFGKLRLNKDTGSVVIIEEVLGDPERRFSSRAERKIQKHWQANEFPDRTCWAS